jgi:vacuolar protein sorting-associated protein 29
MSSNFGELVLVLGDMHVPERASKIPAPFKRMLVPNRMQHVVCTGNVGSSVELWSEIQQLAPSFHCVAGDFDDDSNAYPETCVFQVGQFRIGVIHGHQLLPWGSKESVERIRRKLRVDILVTGHTHQSAVFDENDGFYHINPVRLFSCSFLLFCRKYAPHATIRILRHLSSGINNRGIFFSFRKNNTFVYFTCRSRCQSCLLCLRADQWRGRS